MIICFIEIAVAHCTKGPRPEARFGPGSARWALARPKSEWPKLGPSPLKGGPGGGLHFKPGPTGWPESWSFRPAQKPAQRPV